MDKPLGQTTIMSLLDSWSMTWIYIKKLVGEDLGVGKGPNDEDQGKWLLYRQNIGPLNNVTMCVSNFLRKFQNSCVVDISENTS